jgi:PIN domain nuclease of toxin-antitoxin system
VSWAILVDTPILLWARITPERLSERERRILDEAASRHVSIASLWEIARLMEAGRVGRDERLLQVPRGFELVAATPEHCAALAALPSLGGDCFDRMLVAQARAQRLAILTRDPVIAEYGRHGITVLVRG